MKSSGTPHHLKHVADARQRDVAAGLVHEQMTAHLIRDAQ
jgi:hypothetical protein